MIPRARNHASAAKTSRLSPTLLEIHSVAPGGRFVKQLFQSVNVGLRRTRTSRRDKPFRSRVTLATADISHEANVGQLRLTEDKNDLARQRCDLTVDFGLWTSTFLCHYATMNLTAFLQFRPAATRTLPCTVIGLLSLTLLGCRQPQTAGCPKPADPALAAAPAASPTATATTTNKPPPRRYTYTPRVYPVDERGFSPVDKALQKAYAREEMITDAEDGSLNPYVLKIISAYPLDGSYPYHCGWDPREYDLYNGVTQDMWYQGMVVAKAYPDGSRCSYCCGFTFEVFIRAMKLRNLQKGLEADDFNGMTFNDLFNMLQLWYIEGKGDSEQRGIVGYGLGRAITDFEQVRPGDFLSYSTTPPGGHSVVFIDWIRDDQRKIIGLKYFSSNLSGTKGVGYGQGKFSDSNNGRGLLRNSLRIARVGAIKDYRPFNRAEIPARNAYAPTQPTRILYLPAAPPNTAASK